MADEPRVAVLIDCDNISPKAAKAVFAETARHGRLSIKRAFGDFTSPRLAGWRALLPDLAIQPVQQFPYSTGKNATDSALIIDAMDLLHTSDTDVFCIVSSDSDFTRLATRLRESGKRVYGLGSKSTPVAFRNACDRFTYLEVIAAEPPSVPAATAGRSRSGAAAKTGSAARAGSAAARKGTAAAGPTATEPTGTEPTEPTATEPTATEPTGARARKATSRQGAARAAATAADEPLEAEPPAAGDGDDPTLPELAVLLPAAIEAVAKEDGWASLGEVGSYIVNNHPTFDSRNYGFPKLGDLVRRQPGIRVVTRNADNGGGQLWVRLRAAR
jgi:hypothetical protein